nr:Unknown Function [uncultured bacterium]
MKQLKTLVFPILAASLSCAHQTYDDVRPGEKGIHQVIFKTERKGDGYQAAFKQAKAFCKDVYNQMAFRVSEKSTYMGTNLSEDDYNALKTASKVAVGVGGAVGVLSPSEDTRIIGAATGVGGAIADHEIGMGYEYTLEFKCLDK